eukprot:CAMPEP_0172607800 /NCGR_PEP_ID=MMETSP1068-20121228/27939_1 /TAXON_ID=35684 /ORGANISM="Pseudopedinella elastica, Strain CCMP716" /LENGTH=173 /DNA_ID=CAMNT_0013410891 /DNA_START=95 /DNA_END=614 /DNA_ORIENTATION=+
MEPSALRGPRDQKTPPAMLLHFGEAALADSLRLYFSQDIIQTSASAPLDFKSMIGEGDYRRAVAALYAAKPRGWLTPVETFNPAYSQALAAWALATHLRRRGAGSGADPKSPRRLHLVEVGGGTGLHARLVCDWLSANAPPDVWQGMRYTLLDVSEAQAEKQRASLSESGHGG